MADLPILGIINGLEAIGPALGFIVGGQLLEIFTDLQTDPARCVP